MQWDHLFAKLPDGSYDPYAAELASTWCDLSADELIEACEIGAIL